MYVQYIIDMYRDSQVLYIIDMYRGSQVYCT